MQQVDKSTETQVVGKNQNQQDMQRAQTGSPKKTDQQKPQVVQNTQQKNQQKVMQNGQKQQGVKVIPQGKTQQGAKVISQGKTQQGAKVMQNGQTPKPISNKIQNQTSQQGAKVIPQKKNQHGDQTNQTGQTHKGDQSNLTGKNQENQYDTLCQKMKQRRQNFRIATQELNAAAKQLLTKRKHNKEQYFKHTDAKCRDAIPSMMNAEASTRQGVGSVAAYGKAGVGALSRGVTSLFKKKEPA